MNHCPVYQNIGGHPYGWVYPGPIGSVLTPAFVGLENAVDLPNAATLCNQCGVVCPVKIPLPDLMRKLREKQVERGLRPWASGWASRLWAWAAARPGIYAALTRIAARLGHWAGGRSGSSTTCRPGPAGRATATCPHPRAEPSASSMPGACSAALGRDECARQHSGTDPHCAGAQPADDRGGSRGDACEAAQPRARPDAYNGLGAGCAIPRALPVLVQHRGRSCRPRSSAAPRSRATWPAMACSARGVCWPDYSQLDWRGAGLAIEARPANGDDQIGITGTYCAIAETGTLMLLSGPDTHPGTSLLPETHIALVPIARILRSMEDAWDLLRKERGELPRQVAFVSGPSRTADIEMTLVLGIHGPYRVHIILVTG